MENDVWRGQEAICVGCLLPWPTVWRLARFAKLPVQDLNGFPSLAARDWEKWQQWDSQKGDADEPSATA